MNQQLPERAPDRTATAPDLSPELANDDRWGLVTRIVASRHFAKASQLRELLLYIARVAITDPAHDIAEQELGSHALGRKSDYDPQEDTIVRVQMRHLRERLEKYYATDGQGERLILSIPKGSYVPRFEPHPVPEASAELTGPAVPAAIPRRRWPWLLAAAAVAAFFVGRASVSWTGSPDPNEVVGSPFLSRLFALDQPANIVIADSSVVLIQDLLHLDLSLDGYISRSYRTSIDAIPEPGFRTALRWASNRQYTSLADATLSSRFYSIGKRARAKVAVRFARHLNVRDLNTGNFVMVGSRRGIPWVQLFEPQLNFRLSPEGDTVGFRNLNPQAGEPAGYWSKPVDGPYDTFATVALLPNLSSTGTVLLLNGATMEGSEAAGEFILRPDFPQTIEHLIGADPGDRRTYFEVLLKIATIAGAPNDVRVVAWRRPKH